MLNPSEVRFKADARQTAHAWQVHFPLRLRIHRAASVQALADARRITDQLCRQTKEADLPDARLLVLDPETQGDLSSWEFVIEQKSLREVRLQVALIVSLTLEGAGGFWSRASAIASAADFLQSFAVQQNDKATEVEIQQARLVGKGAETSEMGAESP